MKTTEQGLSEKGRKKLAALREERQRIEKLLPDYVESLALPGKPFGRFKFHKAQEQPWLLYASQQMFSLAVLHGYWEELDETRQSEWLDLLLSTQDPETGLFMCPVVTNQPTAYYRSITIKLARRLDMIGEKPRHPLPRTESVCPAFKDLDRELAALPWNTRAYGAGSKAGFWAMTRIQELTEQGKDPGTDPYVLKIVEFLESHQNPETGFWGSSPNLMDQMNGFLKTLRVHESINRPLPNVEKIVDGMLATQKPDGSFGDNCGPSNAMTIFTALTDSTDYRRTDIQEAALKLSGVLYVRRQPDGLYGSTRSGCLAAHGGVRLCSGVQPISDLVATSQTLSVIKMIEALFLENAATDR